MSLKVDQNDKSLIIFLLGYTSTLVQGVQKLTLPFLNVNNVRTSIRIATPAIYIDRGDL